MPEPKQSISLQTAKEQEAQRRRMLLGPLLDNAYEHQSFIERAHQTLVPLSTLKTWHQQHQQDGCQGLIPTHWQPLDDLALDIALTHYNLMRTFIEHETITITQIAELAKQMASSFRTAERWVKRYRIGGLWGLTPLYNPLKSARAKQERELPRDLGSFDEETLKEIYQRCKILGSLIDKSTTSNTEVSARAAEMQVSERTLWNYLRDYRRHGLAGLAPRQRSDKGKVHQISDKMMELIQAIRFTHLDGSVRAIYELACEKASQLGEVEPSMWQVRNICNKIPKPVKLLADRRENEFRNKYRITYPIQFTQVVYQIDHTRVDVLILDQRNPKYIAKSGETRLWLTLVIEAQSRMVVAFRFAYDQPDRHTVAGVIRDSLLGQPGGVPTEIWVDNGKDLVSTHVRQLTRELGIVLHICAPHQPQHRGIGERFFGTLNTRLWSRLPGYTDANTVERNPTVKAELTPKDLQSEFLKFLDEYHQELHSSLEMSPLAYWTNHCLVMPVADPRILDPLMKEVTTRQVLKTGIKYGGRQYWHIELGPLVGEAVTVRADTRFETPDEIEVYHNNQWLCSAFALDSKRGRTVKPEEIRQAQQQQRAMIRSKIQTAKMNMAIVETDCSVAASKQTTERLATGEATMAEQEKAVGQSEAVPKTRLTRQDIQTPQKDFLLRMSQKTNT